MVCFAIAHIFDWQALLDDAKAGEQATARGRERWLRRQATESATLLGALLDLAEAGVAVSMWTAAGRRLDGVPVGIGSDVVVLRDRAEHVLVRTATITMVRPAPGSALGAATGDRRPALRVGFVELLDRLVDDRPEVALLFDSGDTLAGTLVAVGADVLSVQLATGATEVAYASVARCASVRFRSG